MPNRDPNTAAETMQEKAKTEFVVRVASKEKSPDPFNAAEKEAR
jgi:hypothetical protein